MSLLDGNNAKLRCLRASRLNKLDHAFHERVEAGDIEGALKRAEIIAGPGSEATLGAQLAAKELPRSLERIGELVATENEGASIRRAQGL